jgi:hypothetical protein
MTHLTALPLGQLSSIPWSFHPAWFLLLAFGLPALTWVGLAWKRALDEDPHRLRRAGLRQVRRLLSRVGRSQNMPQPAHLHGWCQAAARTWGIRVSTPTRGQVSGSLHTLTGEDETTRWLELWSSAERALYAAGGATPTDWLERASAAAARVRLPKRERWLPDRLAHWLPRRASAFAVGLAIGCAALLATHDIARADQTGATASAQAPAASPQQAPAADSQPAPGANSPQALATGSQPAPAAVAQQALAADSTQVPAAVAQQTQPTLSVQDQQAAAQAMRLHWNDWAAHYNIAAAQIAQGNWNYAVAHAATAFLLDPTFGANRDNLRFAIQQSGSMDPTLRRLLYGPWFQQFPGLLSPAGWQRVSLFASLILAAAFSALIVMLYFPARRRALSLGGRYGLAAGGALMVVALVAFNDYGMLAHANAGILVEPVNLSPSPTELVPEAETVPASAGTVVLPERSFLGWRRVSPGVNVSGWVRDNAMMPFYQASRH